MVVVVLALCIFQGCHGVLLAGVSAEVKIGGPIKEKTISQL